MKKIYPYLIIVIIVLAALALYLSGRHAGTNTPGASTSTTPIAYECNADAKICPDGSAVGRTGSDCHFMECPVAATSTKITAALGQVATGMNVSVTVTKIISDSRCPKGVQCIWAGTVEVQTTLATQVAHGEHTMKLGEPVTFGDYIVTLVSVTPDSTAGVKIPDSSYRFIFDVKKAK